MRKWNKSSRDTRIVIRDLHFLIFIFDQNLKPKVSTLVKNEVGAQALTLHNLESLTKNDVKNKEDYFSIMQHNIDTLKKALY